MKASWPRLLSQQPVVTIVLCTPKLATPRPWRSYKNATVAATTFTGHADQAYLSGFSTTKYRRQYGDVAARPRRFQLNTNSARCIRAQTADRRRYYAGGLLFLEPSHGSKVK
jgi:hypothetical protein